MRKRHLTWLFFCCFQNSNTHAGPKVGVSGVIKKKRKKIFDEEVILNLEKISPKIADFPGFFTTLQFLTSCVAYVFARRHQTGLQRCKVQSQSKRSLRAATRIKLCVCKTILSNFYSCIDKEKFRK